MDTYLPPIGHPKGLCLKLAYFFMRRQFGKVMTSVTVFAARMPTAFMNYYYKMSKLDGKLRLPSQTAVLIREQVASVNMCLFCMDASRWYVMTKAPGDLARLDALPEYRTSPLFTDAQRAALDYATELTRDKQVRPATFARLARYYNEREICDIVWLVASEHLNNMTNIGLGIGSDGFCELAQRTGTAARAVSRGAGTNAPASRCNGRRPGRTGNRGPAAGDEARPAVRGRSRAPRGRPQRGWR